MRGAKKRKVEDSLDSGTEGEKSAATVEPDAKRQGEESPIKRQSHPSKKYIGAHVGIQGRFTVTSVVINNTNRR